MKNCKKCKERIIERQYFEGIEGSFMCKSCGKEALEYIDNGEYVEINALNSIDNSEEESSIAIFELKEMDAEEIDDIISSLKSDIKYREAYAEGLLKGLNNVRD